MLVVVRPGGGEVGNCFQQGSRGAGATLSLISPSHSSLSILLLSSPILQGRDHQDCLIFLFLLSPNLAISHCLSFFLPFFLPLSHLIISNLPRSPHRWYILSQKRGKLCVFDIVIATIPSVKGPHPHHYHIFIISITIIITEVITISSHNDNDHLISSSTLHSQSSLSPA